MFRHTLTNTRKYLLKAQSATQSEKKAIRLLQKLTNIFNITVTCRALNNSHKIRVFVVQGVFVVPAHSVARRCGRYQLYVPRSHHGE